MITIIAISIFLCTTLTVYGLYVLLFRRSNPVLERLKAQRRNRDEKIREQVEEPVYEEDAVALLAERVAKPINRIVPPSPAEADKLQRQLMQAGYHSHRAPQIFHAVMLISMLGLPLIATLVMFLLGYPTKWIFIVGMGTFALGFFLPRKILQKMIAARHERLQWGLADALDLMVVSMEAGLGMNAAMVRVSDELGDAHPDISKEFEFVNLEIRIGRDRIEALRNLSERTGVEDLRSFVAMLIQADRFGTSIGRAVRVYSESLRTKRRQRAEQEAQKAAVKLLMPLTCFLFPTLFIIILGPAGLKMMDAFGK